MTLFKLRFTPSGIKYWFGRYDNPNDDPVSAFVTTARSRGYLTHAELVHLGEWKSPRIRSRCAANDPEYVEAITRTALSTPNERLRIEVLTLLRGVS